jgi:pyruvate-formate lyase-activating enzyme
MKLNNLPRVDCGVDSSWSECRFLTASVLPVRRACNLDCPFCFSKSSLSALGSESTRWDGIDLDRYFAYSAERGAKRLVITGGGEPLLLPKVTVRVVNAARRWFEEVACFTNGTYLTRELALQLQDAGLSYLCYSRHHDDDDACRLLMGVGAPRLEEFFAAADGLRIRATCVMAAGQIDSLEDINRYIGVLSGYGVQEYTFKHTYVAYDDSVFGDSHQNSWARAHRVAVDPFGDRGIVIDSLPWGPRIRQIENHKVCFYYEPDPHWEKENRLCRSINLLSDGNVYASLEDQRSLLYRQT